MSEHIVIESYSREIKHPLVSANIELRVDFLIAVIGKD